MNLTQDLNFQTRSKLAQRIDNKSCQGNRVNRLPIPNESIARELSKLPEDQQEHVWDRALDAAGDKVPTAIQVRDVVAEWTEVTDRQPSCSRKRHITAKPAAYRIEIKFARFVSTDVERVRSAMSSSKIKSNALGTKLWMIDGLSQIGTVLSNVGAIFEKLESSIVIQVTGEE